MSAQGAPRNLLALQIMGSTVLLLRPKDAGDIFVSYEVVQVGASFAHAKIAEPGDLVHFIKLPDMTAHKKGGG